MRPQCELRSGSPGAHPKPKLQYLYVVWRWGKFSSKCKHVCVLKVWTGKVGYALISLAWASTGLRSPPTTFLVKTRGRLTFIPWNAEIFLTCLPMTPLHFLSAAATISAYKSMQGKACPSGLKVFKEMLLPCSKIVSLSWPLQHSCPPALLLAQVFEVGGAERGDECSYHLK